MAKRKSTKGQTTIYNTTHITKDRISRTQVLRKGKQFLLHLFPTKKTNYAGF
jgi:hypothetical protein